MSKTNINFLKFSFERAMEQHTSNLTFLMRQFEHLMVHSQKISEENARLKQKLIILEGNCNCPIQQHKPPRYKNHR
jgi:hypothetical protein